MMPVDYWHEAIGDLRYVCRIGKVVINKYTAVNKCKHAYIIILV